MTVLAALVGLALTVRSPPVSDAEAAVNGRVVDASGAPVPGARVEAAAGRWEACAASGEDGCFAIEAPGETRGPVRLRVRNRALATVPLPATPTSLPLPLPLPRRPVTGTCRSTSGSTTPRSPRR